MLHICRPLRPLGSASPFLARLSYPPLVDAPLLPECRSCVIVPVRDEAERIESTLAALACQIERPGLPLDPRSYEVIVLANNCRDQTAPIARRFAGERPQLRLHIVERTLSPGEAHVGRARQLLMDEAYRRFAGAGKARGIIASTDGDTRVAPDWLAATAFEIDRGADAVGGRILTDDKERQTLAAQARRCFLFDVGYQYLTVQLEACIDPDPLDAWPRHYQHFGASLALSAEAYARAGGLPAVRSPEDVALYCALRRIDAGIRHSPLVKVITSARRYGRAERGLAAQLADWSTVGAGYKPYLVEAVGRTEERLINRFRLRQLWRQPRSLESTDAEVAALATRLRVPSERLAEELSACQAFGLLWERLNPEEPANAPKSEVEEAIRQLRRRIVLWKQALKSARTGPVGIAARVARGGG
ncbi:glycosyltransferase family A protein [Gloeobacter morelensis]|uniref:Glycosyltransferase family 2 protein n=1 Tax=Gloeobacter morelensis MG652769 TaxID=2781736 RepID=A0ABY3PNW2_9CYAN|nr:glycosyltransferase family A protein [Gloeobacter morelensis]UFP95249.1 glycosyltransferase family 2 protein [Gloeobacter morelensis MG652769]